MTMPDTPRPSASTHQLGKWIKAPETYKRLPLFRKSFHIEKRLLGANLEIVGLGAYEATVNGKRVGDHFCDPPWTDYRKLVLFQNFDVKNLLKDGDNTLGVTLGNGIYNVVGGRYTKFTGSFGPPKLTARLILIYADESRHVIESDATWKVAEGPITFSCHYGGEDYDANLLSSKWDQNAFDDTQWQAAEETSGPGGTVKRTDIGPIRPGKPFEVKTATEIKAGVWVFDMGQNTAAIPLIQVQGPKGASIRITPSELTNSEGLADQTSTGGPMYYDYTLSGVKEETWQPKFTYFGYRYLQVAGAVPKGKPNPDGLPVIVKIASIPVTYSGGVPPSEFKCSNDLVNRIEKLIEWAIDSNTQSVFTDCPHREKLGWLEQVHLMGPSILYSRGHTELMAKACRDMRFSQLANGLVPDIAPEYVVFKGGFRDSPEWGSACVLVPWQVYRFTGNLQILDDNYETMKRYIDYLSSSSKDHIVNHGLGDWYDVGPNPPGYAQLTPIALTATAFYYWDLVHFVKTAQVLKHESDARRYETLAHEAKTAFNSLFFDEKTNQYATRSQCANGIALVMGFVPEDRRKTVLDNLVADVVAHHYRVTAGDVGYRYVIRALADGGRSDVVFKMATVEGKPGYAYQLEQGATALTEAWDALRSSSQNHFMLGHIMEWLYTDLVGIQQTPSSVGFKEIVIAPQVVGGVTEAMAVVRRVGGDIRVSWTHQKGVLKLVVLVPPGSTARLDIPTCDPKSVKIAPVPKGLRREGVSLFVPAGRWEVTAKLEQSK
jgi:hypothetical protein